MSRKSMGRDPGVSVSNSRRLSLTSVLENLCISSQVSRNFLLKKKRKDGQRKDQLLGGNGRGI